MDELLNCNFNKKLLSSFFVEFPVLQWLLFLCFIELKLGIVLGFNCMSQLAVKRCKIPFIFPLHVFKFLI